MNAWSRRNSDADVMGPSVTRTGTAKAVTPPLKNGSDLRESGYLIAVGSRTARFRRRHKNKILMILLLAALVALLCLSIVMTVLYIKQKRHKPIKICESKECLRSAANLALSMDRTVDPCHDFYRHVCGNWAQDHPRPDAYRSYDWFRDKQVKVYTLIRDFLARNTSGYPAPVQQAKDMYSACMDTDTLDKIGLEPVFKILGSIGLPPYPTYINATEDFDYENYKFDWLETVIKIKTTLGMDVLIGFDIFTDPKNSTLYRLAMGSPETTNPFPSTRVDKKRNTRRSDKRNFKVLKKQIQAYDIIFNSRHKKEERKETKAADEEEERIAQIHKLFYAEMIKMFALGSIADKTNKIDETDLDQNILKAADKYYTIDDEIYELSADNDTEVEEDDTFTEVPEYTVDEIQSHTDSIVESNNGTATPIWKMYLEGVFSISDVTLDYEKDKILVSELDLKYMSLLATYVVKLPPVVIELYIWVKVVEVMSVHTTSELRNLFQRAYEQLHSRRYAGAPPRSLVCANAVNDMLGMAVAYAIADANFLNVTKPKIQTMLNEMKNALATLVGKAKWMDDDTKLATYQKIIQMKTLIGYPDWLLEDGSLEEYYKGIEVNQEQHLNNMIGIIQVNMKKMLNKFREGNNVTWATDPTEVNAYHTFQENTITVPLVMLQYPFFDLGLDSLNYGSLGTVLGHEITHGFDNFVTGSLDQTFAGRQFDKNGNMLPWWTNGTIRAFVNMTQCFVDQYSGYYVPELDKHVDGKQTLGENIADNGGVREALTALKRHLTKTGPEPKLPGFERYTEEQMFFLSFGNLWCGVSTSDSLRADLLDEHSPQAFRARGALQNSEEFARAWHCPAGTPMNPAKRCIIF